MPAAKKLTKKKTPAKPTPESGVVYLSSTGSYYSAPEITASKITDFKDNVYARGLARKQENIIFGDKYQLEVLDQDGKQDDDLELDIMRMCDAQDVQLWSKIKMGWNERFWYGPGLFNDVWDYVDGVYTLTKLRHLPSKSFGTAPWNTNNLLYSQILQGITINDRKEIEYYQVQDDLSTPEKVEHVFMVTDPTSIELAGEPIILPLVPIISMLKYVWDTQMKQANRTGAKILFLKVTDPQGANDQNSNVGDIDAAKDILKNWGNDTAYPLRGNMEIVDPQIKDDSNNLEIIEALNQMLIDFISPISFLSAGNDSARLGGSDSQRYEMVLRWVRSEHSWMEEAWGNGLLQKYLDGNGYDGYTVNIHIPTPEIDTSEIDIKRAETGIKAKVLFPNELRVLLGHEEKTNEELLDLEEIYKRMAPPAPTFGFASSSTATDEEPDNVDEEVFDETTEGIQAAAKRMSKGLVAAMVIEEKGSS